MNNTFENITDSERMIHTPSSFARNNLTFAQETGRLKSLKEHSCIRENLESFLFFQVLDGKGIVKTGGKEYKAEKGDVVLLDCRKHYEHRSDAEEPWEIRWVHFYGGVASSLFNVFEEANVSVPVFKPCDGLNEYTELLDCLNEALRDTRKVAEISQSCILEKLIWICINAVADDKCLSMFEEKELHESDDFASLRESVNDHIGEPNLERILSIQYGIQPEALSALFEKRYGISLSDYILNRKLNKAKELLRFTIKSVEEIASESGVEDADKFRELFTSSEEMSPEEYRKKWAQWIKA